MKKYHQNGHAVSCVLLRLLSAILFLLPSMAVEAQQFSATNDDGVSINYSVTSGSEVCVESGSYTGALIVPSQVEYQGTLYTVTGVAEESFAGNNSSKVTYLRLPATVASLGDRCFYNAHFDSLRFMSATPPTFTTSGVNHPFYKIKHTSTILVPCGSMADYRHSQPWVKANEKDAIFELLGSDCSVLIVAKASDQTAPYLISGSGQYDPGDSVLLTYKIGITGEPDETISGLNHLVYGWSDGAGDGPNAFIASTDDTIWLITERVANTEIRINNIQTVLTSVNRMSYLDGGSHYNVPADGNSSTIYSHALWVSGRDLGQGTIYAAANCYNSGGYDFCPGPLRLGSATTDIGTMSYFNRLWTLSRQEIDDFIANVGRPDYEIPENILTWPCNGDPENGFAATLAPYYDANGDNHYNPHHGDYPLIKGDRAVFAIFNDGGLTHGESGGDPMGIEVHAMYYGFDQPDDTVLHNTLFVEYTVINRSNKRYEDARLTAFTDLDIGYGFDDFAGCDVDNSFYYGYNGDEVDGPGTGAYEGIPPAQGCALLSGPTPVAQGMPVMDNFVCFYNNTGNTDGQPTNDEQFYNYSRALWKNGSQIKYGSSGITCRYMFPGDSDPRNLGTDGISTADYGPWSAVYTNDIRGVASCASFTMEPNIPYTLSIAFTTAFGSEDQNSSVARLRQMVPELRRQFLHDTIDAGRSFTYRPYSQAHNYDGSIEDVEEMNPLRLYPNPTRGIATIECPSQSMVVVYDMKGREVYRAKCGGGAVTINTASWQSGIYIVKCGSKTARLIR